MPNHFHGIIVIEQRAWNATTVTAGSPKGTERGSLPAIIQNFKSVSTRRINQFEQTSGRRVWQEDYYEHIVRNATDMERIRRYIAANPSQWRG
jgi:putative transposase